VAGRPLGGLGLGDVAGRVDLRGLPAPAPRRLARYETAGWFVEELGGLIRLRQVTLRGLDLSGAFLDSFRLRNCLIEDCVLDRARCQDWRIWDSEIRDTSFRGANLRETALGPWKAGKGNLYSQVDFARADFRGSAWMTAVFSDCDFSGAKLHKVQFLRCGLVRCRFAGLLTEMVFDSRVFHPEEREPNVSEDIDMSGAVFRLTEFRGVDLTAVKLPDDPRLRVIYRYPCVLEAAIADLGGRDDKVGRVLRAVFKNELLGLECGHPLGFVNLDDFVSFGGEEHAAVADELLRRAEKTCETAT